MNRRTIAEQHDRLQRELTEERAAALRRISNTLEALIHRCTELRSAVRAAPADQRNARLAEYRQVRAQAVKYRWYLEVQREAIGLRHHQGLDEFYAIPPGEP